MHLQLMETLMPLLLRIDRTARHGAVGAALMLAWFLPAADAGAQNASTRRILSPEETRQCVCMEDEIAAIRARTDPIEQEFDRLGELLENARVGINVDDQAEVDSFRRIHARREALRQELHTERGSQWLGMISHYNRDCANQRMLRLNVDAVRANPNACPQ
jgi:hypothetical protein